MSGNPERRLIHYSDKPLLALLPVAQADEVYDWHDGRKPAGLWVSAEGEDDWAAWCESEDFRDTSKQVATEIILKPDHRVLYLRTDTDMMSFNCEYGVQINRYGSWLESRIDWPRLALTYDGIVIAPYQWHHRLDGPCHDWYYTWDCASGCLWNDRSVLGLREIKKLDAVSNA